MYDETTADGQAPQGLHGTRDEGHAAQPRPRRTFHRIRYATIRRIQTSSGIYNVLTLSHRIMFVVAALSSFII